eukprot:5269572-Prymnesium_polylepis.1
MNLEQKSYAVDNPTLYWYCLAFDPVPVRLQLYAFAPVRRDHHATARRTRSSSRAEHELGDALVVLGSVVGVRTVKLL